MNQKKKGTEIHKKGDRYYLYRVSSKWDKELKKARKVTEEYLGVITPQGFSKPRASKTHPISVKEEEDYLRRIKTHPEYGYTVENFRELRHSFGTLSLYTNLKDLSGEKIYTRYKERAEIESLFDIFKNMLGVDKTYMRSDSALEGWFFINYLALTYYYQIYNLLKQNNLLGNYSPSDLILNLSRVRKVKTEKKWINLEIPKKTTKLLEKLQINIT